MYALFLPLFCLVGLGHGAPTAGANPLLAPQFVVLTPPQAQPAFHYEPAVKLEQPLFQQITPLGRLETPQKQQLLLLYPNGPLTQYPLISLRQDGGAPGNGDFWQSIQNFFQNIGGNFGATEAPPPPPPAAGGGDAAKTEPQFFSAKPSTILEAPASNLLPASTVPLTEKRYYILSGQPQFYGKYDALNTPLNSVFHLQPLQSVESRSAAGGILAASDASAIVPLSTQALPQELAQLPAEAALPLQNTAEPLQLRSAFQEPLAALEPMAISMPAEPQAAEAAPALKDSSVEASNEEPRSLVVLPEPERDEKPETQARGASETIESEAGVGRIAAEGEQNAADEPQPSVASARPTGIAVAGRGGVASAKPSATALVGDGGLANASPMATAISGEFKDVEEEEEEEFISDKKKALEKAE